MTRFKRGDRVTLIYGIDFRDQVVANGAVYSVQAGVTGRITKVVSPSTGLYYVKFPRIPVEPMLKTPDEFVAANPLERLAKET